MPFIFLSHWGEVGYGVKHSPHLSPESTWWTECPVIESAINDVTAEHLRFWTEALEVRADSEFCIVNSSGSRVSPFILALENYND